ncbi:MAG: hypothetical protein WBZ01_04685 [Terriglobales bacterium]
MKRTNILAALTCALLVFVLAGCGTTNKLQSVTLGASLINGLVPTGQSGFFNLQGNGGTIQLSATANYTNGKSIPIHGAGVVYNIVVDPVNNIDAFGNPLPPPCIGTPCAQTSAQGTVQLSPTGLVTAVEPATCTWVDIAPVGSATPAYFYSGDYQVTVTYQGVISQPAYIPVASSAGNQYYPYYDEDPANLNNPTGLCGPQPTS